MTTVVLIRHGRTASNATGVLSGRSSGIGLDDTGHEQVRRMADRLAGVSLAAVVSSPLQRCRQTASALVTQQPERTVTVDKGLIECGYGAWTGRKLAELAKDPLWKLVQTQPSAVRFPDGEALVEMSARAQATIHAWDRRVTDEHGEHAVWAAVSHGDVIKSILAAALGMHLDAFQRILVDPASVSVIRLGTDRPYVATMNSTSGDLAPLLAPPRRGASKRGRAGRGRRRSDPGAAIGGGLGTADRAGA